MVRKEKPDFTFLDKQTNKETNKNINYTSSGLSSIIGSSVPKNKSGNPFVNNHNHSILYIRTIKLHDFVLRLPIIRNIYIYIYIYLFL